jgi:putative ABC transport system permease protein
MITGVMSAFESELFRLPVVVEPSTFLVSAAAVLGSMAISAWTVRRKLHDLDLVAVLKTRE